MSSTIRSDAERVYRDHATLPPEWTPAQRSAFLDQEAARLGRLTAETAAELGEAATAAWTDRTGEPPDYLTTVGLLNNAKLQAQEQVLAEELYSQIEPEPEPAEAEDEATAVDWGNPDRWRTLRRSEPTAAVTALVAQLWPTRSHLFAIKAEYLIQTRTEDGLEVPQDPTSDLARELADLVDDDLRADGLPLR